MTTRPQARGHLERREPEEVARTLSGASGGSAALGHLDLRRLAPELGESEAAV